MMQSTVHKLDLFSHYTVRAYPYIPDTSSPCSERKALLPAYARPSPSHNLGCYLRLSHHLYVSSEKNFKGIQNAKVFRLCVKVKKDSHFPEF